MWTPFDGLIGKYVYVEAGPNYAECGKLREVHVDELGVMWGIFDDVRRKDDERDGDAPTFLIRAGDDVRIPSTAITLLQPMANRWPSFAPPQLG